MTSVIHVRTGAMVGCLGGGTANAESVGLTYRLEAASRCERGVGVARVNRGGGSTGLSRGRMLGVERVCRSLLSRKRKGARTRRCLTGGCNIGEPAISSVIYEEA